MSTQPTPDVMTLAGLALANGPWLAVRLRRLAEHAGHPLSEEVLESAVLGSSRVLAQVLNAEGRPAVSADHETDPAAILGREQAQVHRQAGMDMPGSLRVLRLLRRDYDDLVRESWVEKESRARAHEDVERFFERMLIGHFVAWAGSVAAPPAASPAAAAEAERLSGLLAQREDELKRAMDAVRKATTGLRKSTEHARALAAELAQAQVWAKGQLEAQETLRTELAAAKQLAAKSETGAGDNDALRSKFAAAQARLEALVTSAKAQEAQRADLEARLAEAQSSLAAQRADLETRLAEAQSSLAAQREVEEARAHALREIDSAQADAEANREALRKAREEAQGAIARAESQTQQARRELEQAREQAQREVHSARAEAEAAVEELRRAREGHATLLSEADAMRARLAETGSRMAEARQTEEIDIQARLAQAQEHNTALEAKLREAGQSIQAISARLSEQESLHAFKDERMREQSRAVAETQELLIRLGATKDEIISRAQTAEAEREKMSAERDTMSAEREKIRTELAAARKQLALEGSARLDSAAQAEAARARSDSLGAELAQVRLDLEAAIAGREEISKRSTALETERNGLAERLIQTGNALEQASRQGQTSAQAHEACVRLLSTHLALTPDAVLAVDARGAITAWNPRFAELFGLAEADRAGGLKTILPRLAARLEQPKPWLQRMQELLANPGQTEEGLTLATTTGQTLVFRSRPATGPNGGPAAAPSEEAGITVDTKATAERLFHFRDVSLEHDMEHLVREIESITREELGQSLTAFIHLPQELLNDPATTPEQTLKLTKIRDSGYRIVNTVNMAVDIFRMERGLYQMPPGSTLDLAVVARRAAKDAGPLAASRQVRLELLLGAAPLPADAVLPGPGYAIPAHALALNLLRDALESAPRQSRVLAMLGVDEAAGALCLDITRPGTLSPEEQAGFFDKPVGKGSRNGLARARYTARLIADSFGGSLSVRSSPETGTVLSLRLPRK